MLAVSLLFLVLLALGLAALVGVVLWRAGRWGLAAAGTLAFLIGWGAFRAAHPEPAFYTALFERETGLAFPASGEILDRGATVPDMTGDFCAEAVASISPRDAERLRVALRRAGAEPQTGSRFRCEDVALAARGPYLAATRDEKDGRWLWWGVSEDGRTLAFQYVRM